MKIIAVKVFQLKQLKRRNLKKSGLNGDGVPHADIRPDEDTE